MLATASHLKVVSAQPDELESLFREHSDRVFRAAYRITGTVVDAEDVVQTIFLRLARRSDGAKLEPNPASYLHRAAVNASLDLLRQRARADSVPLDDMSELIAHSGLSPEALQRNRELRAIIQKAIGELGEKTAEMFILRYFEGYDNHEIADMLGTSQVLVGVLLHRARTRMRKEISKVLEGSNEPN